DVLVGIKLFILPQGHLDAGEDKEGTKDVHDPGKFLDEEGSHANESAAHHEGSENAPEEDAMLVFVGHLEIAEEHDDDEDIVGRKRQLDQIAGREEQGLFRASPQKEEARKNQRK